MFTTDETLEQARIRNIEDALREDLGTGDRTGRLIPAGRHVQALVTVREDAVLAGRDWFEGCMRAIDAATRIAWRFDEGADLPAGAVVCEIEGEARAVLSGERPALNFLQLLSAVAGNTRRHVRAIEGASPNPRGCRVLDTRKTFPGLRQAQKYAVRIGGGQNQRLALWHGILIKENHITAAGGVTAALVNAFALDAGVPVQIEVETLDQLREALAAGATSVLLDNFDEPAMREAVTLTSGPRTARSLRRRHLGPVAWHRGHRRRPHLGRQTDQGRSGGRLLDASGLTGNPAGSMRLSRHPFAQTTCDG